MSKDLESGDKKPLLQDDGGSKKQEHQTDIKDAAFWLFMLFLASVTMTVGNKVRFCFDICCSCSQSLLLGRLEDIIHTWSRCMLLFVHVDPLETIIDSLLCMHSFIDRLIDVIFTYALSIHLLRSATQYVMKKWDFANTLTLMQNGMAVLYLGAGRAAGMLDMKPFAAQQWKVFAVSSFFLAMQILTSLKALPFVAIATVVAFRNTCTVIIAIIDYMFFGTQFSKPQVLALAMTTAGMIIYAMRDINFNMMGYLWLAGNSVATIFNTFWNKFYITHYTKELKIQTSYGVSFIQQLETLPIVLVLAVANEEGAAFSQLSPLDPAAKAMVFATCLGGILIGIAYPKCFSLVSGTSVVVASTANKAVSILIGMWLFGTRLSGLQVVGLMICIAGSLWYAVEGKRGNKRKV